MANVVLDGTITGTRYKHQRTYPGQGGTIYFNTYQTYDSPTGRAGGGISPTSLRTYLLIEKSNGVWYKGAELGENGRWIPLTERQSGILVPGRFGTPGTFRPIPNATDKRVLGDVVIRDLAASGTNTLRAQAIGNAKNLLRYEGRNSENDVNTAFNVSSNISAPGHSDAPGLFGPPIAATAPTPEIAGAQPPPGSPAAPEAPTGLSGELDDYLEKLGGEYLGRTKYPSPKDSDLRYPLNLSTKQDCIQFTIIKYQPRGLSPNDETRSGIRRPSAEKESLATITLPIGGGISDRNTVDWNSGSMSVINQEMANTVNTFLTGGTQAATDAASTAVQGLLSDTKALEAFAAAKVTASALSIQDNELLAREYGTIANPNLELLFSNPSLRSFSFSFRMSPRSEEEAIAIRTIIRYFKQAMSVKRNKSVLLLKAPHTFRIKYLSESGNSHPYLNQFKECALTECGINYTPDGTYMTFDGEPSMTAYEMQLTFQELEPIFDDDYEDGDNYPTNIGY